jgi:hypothetical protein
MVAAATGLSPTLQKAHSSHVATVTALSAPLWWEKVYGSIESGLRNRQRMLQFGAVGMLLALAIIWWRK